MNIKALAKDTALYGLSSIVGKFLNYLLVPLYTYKIAAQSGDYGIVTNLYAYSALLVVLLTFGMETTFFRFCGKKDADDRLVFSTALRMVGSLGLVFVALVFAFLPKISAAMGYPAHPEYIALLALIVFQDAFQSIVFARLREQHKPLRFVALKLGFIIPNILLNLFIFLILPRLCGKPSEVGMIFVANLVNTTIISLFMLREIRGISFGFDRKMCRRMLCYTWPLLLLGIVGMLNQVADKILFPQLVPGSEGQVQLGIYGACVKLAMIMAMLTQAFRYAYEPIVFGNGRNGNDPQVLSEGMKYFIVFALLAWLCVMAFLPLLKFIIHPDYREGMGVIPIVMMAEIFMGVYFNLSFWYKLTDRTWWGAVLSAAGAAVTIAVNVVFVPKAGYIACAWGGLAGYGTSMLLSLIAGKGKMNVRYDWKKIGAFSALFALFAAAILMLRKTPETLQVGIGAVLAGLYGLVIYKKIK